MSCDITSGYKLKGNLQIGIGQMSKILDNKITSTETDEALFDKSNRTELSKYWANEAFVALVGPIGSGNSYIIEKFKSIFKRRDIDIIVIRVSELLESVKDEIKFTEPKETNSQIYDRVVRMQNIGDAIRETYAETTKDYSAVSKLIFRQIRIERKKYNDKGTKNCLQRIFIIDSLKHYDEVFVLREVYESAFFLLGVGCGLKERKNRLSIKFFNKKFDDLNKSENGKLNFILKRDEKADEKQGQQVAKTFYLSDYFIDNTIVDFERQREIIKKFSVIKYKKKYLDEIKDKNNDLNELFTHLNRFSTFLLQESVVPPTLGETAMHHAHSAKLRSACLSRQVGAAIVDKNERIVSTGTNEVPKAGGGIYNEKSINTLKSDSENRVKFNKSSYKYVDGDVKKYLNENSNDHRCFLFKSEFCSNTRMQNKLIDEILDKLSEKVVSNNIIRDKNKRIELIEEIRKLRIGGLIEFSRAVHAEMHAILSASNDGYSLRGSKMYVTTFPCHNCARHIVVAGIHEVYYIEPYPKSLALELHFDSITTNPYKNEKTKSNRETENSTIVNKDNVPNESMEIDKNVKEKKLNTEILSGESNGIKKVLFRPFVGVSPNLYNRVFLKDREFKDENSGIHVMGNFTWKTHYNIYTIHYKEREEKLEWIKQNDK